MAKKSNNGFKSIDALLGWNKTDSQSRRRKKVLDKCKGDSLWAAKELQRIANNYPDHEVRRKARVDAAFFIKRHRQRKSQRGSK